MSTSFVLVYMHVVGAILLVGYALFWTVMTAAARREFAPAQAGELLAITRTAPWPLSGGKLNIATVGWLLLIFVLATGVASLPEGFSLGDMLGSRFGRLLLVKLILVAALVGAFHALKPTSRLAPFICLGLTLAVIVASALLVR